MIYRHDCSTDEFLEIVRKSIGMKELTSEILHEFIDHIVVHHAENFKGERVQKIEIYYNCIALFDAPKMDEGSVNSFSQIGFGSLTKWD